MTLAYREVGDYEEAAIAAALGDLLAPFGGWDGVLGAAEKVLLKPNFVVPEAVENGACTHPAVYLTVAAQILATGRAVTIGESPAFGSCAGALRKHGVLDRCAQMGIGVLTFRDVRPLAGPPADPRYAHLTIAAELADFDAVVNLPKLKVHQQFYFTGATKNLYGCVPGKRKTWRHFTSGNDVLAFARMILANARAVAPCLNLVDGIVAMHEHGPIKGRPYPLGCLAAADDFLALDWLCCRRAGLDPHRAPLFRILPAAERARLEAAVAPVLARVPAAEGFREAAPNDIRFGLRHLARSLWRSWQMARREAGEAP